MNVTHKILRGNDGMILILSVLTSIEIQFHLIIIVSEICKHRNNYYISLVSLNFDFGLISLNQTFSKRKSKVYSLNVVATDNRFPLGHDAVIDRRDGLIQQTASSFHPDTLRSYRQRRRYIYNCLEHGRAHFLSQLHQT